MQRSLVRTNPGAKHQRDELMILMRSIQWICLFLLLCGCTTNTVHVFHGRIENLTGDGWIEEGTRAVGAVSSTPSKDNGRILTLSFDPTATFVLRHPLVGPEKALSASSTNG